MRLFLLATAASAIVALAGCDRGGGDRNDALSIEMNSQADAGKVAVRIPGIDAKLTVPSAFMKNGDFDIDGVKLYPKSNVATFNLNVTDKQGAASTGPTVRMGFIAPADPSTVAAWYKAQFAAKGVPAVQRASGFDGRTKDGDSFAIALAPAADGQTRGDITVTEAR